MGNSILPLASVVSTLGGLVFGYELGIISGALLQLRAEFRLSCVQQGALVSSLLSGALLASIVGGFLIDRHGRRNSIVLSNLLILSGSLLTLISSYCALVLGRITVGFAMCISSMSCCIFVSEMVTPNRRGFLVTLYEAGITVGILAAYATNYLLSDSTRGWKWMFGLAVVPALMQLLSIWFLPSTAKESSSQGAGSQTERDLMSTIENQEADDPKEVSPTKVQHNSMYLFQRKDNMRTRTVIGLGLVLFQQFTGQPNVLFYASTIFHSVGFQSDASAVLASVGLGLVKVVATFTSMVFTDRVGRRPLLIGGCSVMALCLITIALLSGDSVTNARRPCNSENYEVNRTEPPHVTSGNLHAYNESKRLLNNSMLDEDAALDNVGQEPLDTPQASPASMHSRVLNWIILFCMMAVVCAYSVGFGPLTWLLLSEIFPAAIRGRAFAFTNCFNWGANLLVTFTFLNLIEAIGLSGVFLLYGLSAVAAAVFFYYMLPETKGKTLDQIDKELRINRSYHSEECCCIDTRWRNASQQYQRVHCPVSSSGRLI